MNREWLELAIRLAGCVHFCILVASGLVPKVLDWPTRLAPLPQLMRRLFWVYGCFIVLVIVCFGLLSVGHAKELTEGTPLARGVCVFIAVFWIARLAVQCFVFDARPFLTTWWLRLGYHSLTIVFILLPVPYVIGALGWVK